MMKNIFILLFCAGSSGILLLCYNHAFQGIDDANIFMVYMRNFAEGHGLVYNTSGPPVEGFSSLLWVLTGSLVYLIAPDFEIGLMVVCLLLTSSFIASLIHFCDRLLKDHRLFNVHTIAILFLFVGIPGFFDWMVVSLMDTALYTCILSLAVLQLLTGYIDPPEAFNRRNRLFSLFLFLLILTRPEAYLWAPLLVFFRWFQAKQAGYKGTERLTAIRLPLLTVITTLAGLFSWRLWYFGYPLPNTYYAKVSANWLTNLSQGADYILSFFANVNPLAFAILSASVIYLLFLRYWHKETAIHRILFILSLLIIIHSGTVLVKGGDHFTLGRMYQVWLPLYYVTGILFWHISVKNHALFPHHRIKKLSFLCLAVFITFLPKETIYTHILRPLFMDEHTPEYHFQFNLRLAHNFREKGRKLSNFFEANPVKPSYGVLAAGGIQFTYEGKIIDMLGLNNVQMAHANPNKTPGLMRDHASFHKPTFYQLKPDLFLEAKVLKDTSGFTIYENRPNRDVAKKSKFYKFIYRDTRFQKTYQPVYIFHKNRDEICYSYMHKDFPAKLDSSIYRIEKIER